MSDNYPHSSYAISLHADRVDQLRDELSRVTANAAGALAVTRVVVIIQGYSHDGPALSSEECDRLSSLLTSKRDAILSLFAGHDVRRADAGINAIQKLLDLWAVAGNLFVDRPDADLLADLHGWSRWLRNGCHNFCLLAEIEERASQRAAVTVQALQQLSRTFP